MNRLVVILCGPAGAGKTTAARESGLAVYDRDDPQWTSEKQFTERLAEIARDPHARAVVIRSAATSSARARWSNLVCATHVYVLTLPKDELATRVRNRHRADMVRGLSSINTWFDSHDRDDGVAHFPGWAAVLASEAILATSETW